MLYFVFSFELSPAFFALNLHFLTIILVMIKQIFSFNSKYITKLTWNFIISTIFNNMILHFDSLNILITVSTLYDWPIANFLMVLPFFPLINTSAILTFKKTFIALLEMILTLFSWCDVFPTILRTFKYFLWQKAFFHVVYKFTYFHYLVF